MQKVRLYTVLLGALAIIGGLGILFVILRLTPDHPLNLYLFYLLVSLFSFALFALAGVYIRKVFGQRELLNQYLALSCRQALWFMIILVVSLFLSSHKLFSWLNATFLVLALVFLESYLLTKNDR